MRTPLAAIAVAALLAACGTEPAPPSTPDAEPPAAPAYLLPESIVAERGGFIPEGVEYDMMNGRLLTGSLAEGTVFEIHGDGRVTAHVSDAELVSSVGIEADETRDRLLVGGLQPDERRAYRDGRSRGGCRRRR